MNYPASSRNVATSWQQNIKILDLILFFMRLTGILFIIIVMRNDNPRKSWIDLCSLHFEILIIHEKENFNSTLDSYEIVGGAKNDLSWKSRRCYWLNRYLLLRLFNWITDHLLSPHVKSPRLVGFYRWYIRKFLVRSMTTHHSKASRIIVRINQISSYSWKTTPADKTSSL